MCCLISQIVTFSNFCYSFLILLYCNQRTYTVRFQSFNIYGGLLHGPTRGLLWRMFHVHLRRTCVLLSMGSAWYKRLSGRTSLGYCFNLLPCWSFASLFNSLLNVGNWSQITAEFSISPFGFVCSYVMCFAALMPGEVAVVTKGGVQLVLLRHRLSLWTVLVQWHSMWCCPSSHSLDFPSLSSESVYTWQSAAHVMIIFYIIMYLQQLN